MRVLILLLSFTAHAEEDYTYIYFGKTVHVKITEVNGVRVNDVCQKAKKCQALEELRHPPAKKELLTGAASDLPSTYCRQRKGTPVFLKKETSSAFCAFPDLSMVDATELYKAAHP